MAWGSLKIIFVCNGHIFSFNSLRLRQIRCHFADGTFKCIFLMKMFELQLKFLWIILLGFQLIIHQHWFRSWLGAEQATSHYLNQWGPVHWRLSNSSAISQWYKQGVWTPICVTQPQWFKERNDFLQSNTANIWWLPVRFLLTPLTT